MRKKFLIVLVVAGIFTAFCFSAAAAVTKADASFKLAGEESYEAYRVRIYRNEEGSGYFEILRHGKRVYYQKGYRFGIGLLYSDEEFRAGGNISNASVRMGRNITGNGVPDLVVNEWSGGAHCCYTFYVFEIGKQFKKIATLDAADGDLAHFEDRHGDGRLEFIANDWTFAYWNVSFAGSPAPEVVLSWQNGEYALDFDLMRKPPPSQQETEDRIKDVRGDDSWQDKEAPPALWSFMLDLIYSGNAEAAWNFLDRAWVPGISGKERFRRDFESQLGKSPYWEQIEKMNRERKN